MPFPILNIVLGDTAKNSTIEANFFGTVERLYTFFLHLLEDGSYLKVTVIDGLLKGGLKLGGKVTQII